MKNSLRMKDVHSNWVDGKLADEVDCKSSGEGYVPAVFSGEGYVPAVFSLRLSL